MSSTELKAGEHLPGDSYYPVSTIQFGLGVDRTTGEKVLVMALTVFDDTLMFAMKGDTMEQIETELASVMKAGKNAIN